MIPHTLTKLYEQKGVMHPWTVVEETANIAHRIKQSQKNHFLLCKFIFSCSLAKLDTAFLAQGAPQWSVVLLLRWLSASGEPRASNLWPKKGTRQGIKRHQSQPAVLSIWPALGMTGLLHCSYQHTRVQGQPWCTHWKLTLPVSCSQHGFKPRLPIISSCFVYYCGASGQTKKEPHCAQHRTEMLN